MGRSGIALILIVSVLLVSCATGANVSPSEARFALLEAGQMACDAASSSMGGILAQTPFIPPQTLEVLRSPGNIPGLDYLIGQWNEAASAMCLSLIPQFSAYLKDEILALEPESWTALVSREHSMTDLLKHEREEEALSWLETRLGEVLDRSGFERIILQYNDYIASQSLFAGGGGSTLEADPVPYIAGVITELFFAQMSVSEVRLRTTPDLSLDSTFVKVFGLGV